VCREHGIVLVSIDVDDEPLKTLRRLEQALSRATSQLAQNADVPHARKQALMPLLSQARRRSGELPPSDDARRRRVFEMCTNARRICRPRRRQQDGASARVSPGHGCLPSAVQPNQITGCFRRQGHEHHRQFMDGSV
jgi:hypothetical protein